MRTPRFESLKSPDPRGPARPALQSAVLERVPELVVNVVNVNLYGRLTDEQKVRDLKIREAVREAGRAPRAREAYDATSDRNAELRSL